MTKTMPFHLPKLLRLVGPCLAMLALSWLLAPASARAGGLYNVVECSPGHTATPNASVQGVSTDFSASTSCASGNWLQVQSAASAPAGAGKQWSYVAPVGTRIERFKADYNLVGDPDPDGNRSYLFIRRDGESDQVNLSVVGLGSTTGTYDSALQGLGPFSAVGVGVFCSKSIGSCGYAPGQFSRLSGISFRMEDVSPPSVPVVEGSAADGNWINGTTQVAVGDVDLGGGVYRTTVEVNGVQVINDVICNPGQDGNGYVGTMTPCDAIELRYIPLATDATPFMEGSGNAVRVCTHEYGFGAASTCTNRSFRIDNVPPGSPRSIDVGGGQGWRRDNDFDLSWVNPAQSDSPIAAAVVRISGPGGYVDTATYPGDDISSVEGISVPDVGAYRADVHLIDAAGNGSTANKASVDLKFDDTVPVKSDPEKANGWVSRDELLSGYEQRWSKPGVLEVPPSGIAGYRVLVDAASSTDPCAGAADPRTCAGPLTEIGVNNTSRTLSDADLTEGINHIHVVPVSGSGMRAITVGHTPIKVDLTDPGTVLSGTPDGWVNHSVELEAVAEDGLSGMADTAEYPDDAPPATTISVDGDVQEDPDAAVSATVAGQGTHQVKYWARDLAGNSNDGAGANASPGSAVVRIDTTPPEVAFSDGQDPADPDRLVAPVRDGLSGVVAGSISYRISGGDRWIPLETSLDGQPADRAGRLERSRAWGQVRVQGRCRRRCRQRGGDHEANRRIGDERCRPLPAPGLILRADDQREEAGEGRIREARPRRRPAARLEPGADRRCPD